MYYRGRDKMGWRGENYTNSLFEGIVIKFTKIKQKPNYTNRVHSEELSLYNKYIL